MSNVQDISSEANPEIRTAAPVPPPLTPAQRLAFGEDEPNLAAKRTNCNEEDAERWDGLS